MGARPKGRGCLTLAVLLGCVALLAGAQTALAAEGTGRISGTVTSSSKAPIQHIEITVYETTGSELPVGFATTDAGGKYTVEGLTGGSYKVEFAPEFGSNLNYVTQYYKNKPSLATAEPFAVIEGATTEGIDAELQTGGEIKGKVTGAASKGDLKDIEVTVYEVSVNEFAVGYATTDASGEYTVVGLATGPYKVRFSVSSESGLNYVTQYYHDKPSLALAEPVGVVQEKTTEGVDAELQTGGKVTGAVTDVVTHAPVASIYVFAVDSSEAFVGMAITNASGQYTIMALASGSYKIEFADLGSDPRYITQYYNGQPSFASANPVSVTQGSTTAGINAALIRKAPINTGAPVVSGTPAVGRSLSCSRGSWTGSPVPTFTYTWLRNGAAIPGAIRNTYGVQAADRGHGLACKVTATNKSGSAAAVSNVLAVPAPLLPQAPVISLSASKVLVVGGSAQVPIGCAHANCTGTITLTKRVVVRHRHGRRTTFKRKTLILGYGSYALPAGHTATIQVRLTATGKHALARARHHRLSAKVIASVIGGTTARKTVVLSQVVTATHKHKHRHRHRHRHR
jgi:Carboxypeptidase regulatory-like domain